MFQNKFVLDAVIVIIVSVIAALVNNSTKLKGGWRAIITMALVAVGFIFASWNHHWLFFAPSAVAEGAKTAVTVGKTAVKEVSHNFPWFRVVLALIVIGGTILQTYRAFKPKSWFGNKPDYWSGVSTIICGTSISLGIITTNHLVVFICFLVAIATELAVMNVQVPEQELYTPKVFGRRCYGTWWMGGKYCFTNGWNWCWYPRNFPGLTFNVAKPRKGVSLKCVTAKVPTKGFAVKGPDGNIVELVGGDVDIMFTLLNDTYDDLEAFYSSPDEIRNDPAKLAAYASDIYGAEFREVLKGLTLDEIQVGNVLKSHDFKNSRELYERGSGHKVTSCLIEDPTPSQKVQDQLNAYAAKRIEVIQTELEASIALIKAEGAGKARLAGLKPLMDALADRNTGTAVREAVAAVRAIDFAANSNLRVLVEKELGPLMPLMPLMAEAAQGD